ncbi:unnamed protein product [Diamesa serratosioi]
MSSLSEQNCDVHLHAEIELLKKALADKQSELYSMTTACYQETDRQVELEDSVLAWQDKFERLYESHKRVQKINQNLEDKLLKLVDRNSGERAQLTSDCATLSVRLAQANYNISNLQREIERYKVDMSLAIQLLQCKPDSFIPQKITSLPFEMQSKVASYMRLETNSHHSDSEGSTGGVGVATTNNYHILPANDDLPPAICPFPPTAMVNSMRGADINPITDNQQQSGQLSVSPSVIAKFLEDELKSREVKHCDTCNCGTKDLTVLADIQKSYSIGTQTIVQGEAQNSLCLRCNSNMNSPSRTNSPYIIKAVKSSDSVISETKSSVSIANSAAIHDKLYTPKKDDLMVNPILGHHRLCDRTNNHAMHHHNTHNDIGLLPLNVSSPKVTTKSMTTDNYSRNIKSNNNTNIFPLKKPHDFNAGLKHEIINSDDNFNSVGNMDDKHGNHKGNSQQTPLSHGPGNGSTNSLWSRASSKEGAKLFESFNRNLIKTIKAENPKKSGPRICALRIQNGSNNILLDNAQGEVRPVIYTRRTRLLDEELDDDKDITTGNIPINSASSQLSILMSSNSNQSNVGGDAPPISLNKTDSEKFSGVGVGVGDLSKNSGTQSSSISSEIDHAESVMLRRQQLSRVAEWVQNSSKLVTTTDIVKPNETNILDSSCLIGDTQINDSINNNKSNNNNNNNINQVDSNAINAQLITNQGCASMMYKQSNNNNNNNKTLISQDFAQVNNLVDIGDDEMLVPLQNDLNNNTQGMCGGDNLDLAQMEYNVKQFLLKQNEWSINKQPNTSSKQSMSSSITSEQMKMIMSSNENVFIKQPQRTETNL